jgi:hypothetical protein
MYPFCTGQWNGGSFSFAAKCPRMCCHEASTCINPRRKLYIFLLLIHTPGVFSKENKADGHTVTQAPVTGDWSHSKKNRTEAYHAVVHPFSRRAPFRESGSTAQRLDAFPSVLQGQFKVRYQKSLLFIQGQVKLTVKISFSDTNVSGDR